MKLPFSSILSWLPSWKLSPETSADILTSLGIEVESIERKLPTFSGVVVGEVKSVEAHPEADKLQVATVYDGTDSHTVVCGAKNCREGLKVAYAPVGATLKGKDGSKTTLKKVQLRGIESSGMLASEFELGISENHTGIWELNAHETTGDSIDKYFKETILDLSLTPNLAHCQSAFGIACELAASQGMPLPKESAPAISMGNCPIKPKIETKDELCTRYSVAYLAEVKDAKAPLWLKAKLAAYGIRSIGAIVDTIAYVMLEDGLPMHGFDAKLIEGATLVCKEAASIDKQQRSIETLDGNARILEANDLVICDEQKPVAIAGIMGGKNSQVNDQTTSLVIEAAIFHPISIRKTARRLCLRTEAAMRYEKGCNPEITLYCLNKVVELLEKMQICQQGASYATVGCDLKPITLNLSTAQTNKLLGLNLSQSEIALYLERLGFSVQDTDNSLVVTVPLSRRHDIKAPIDLVEEVMRIHGLENFPDTSPLCAPSEVPNDPRFVIERKIRQELIRSGIEEFMTCNLISEEMLQPWEGSFDPSLFCRVNNPGIVEYSLLRPSLLPGLVAAVKRNLGKGQKDIAAFEVGYVHMQDKGSSYIEPLMASLILTGNKSAPHFSRNSPQVDFLDLKGILMSLFERLRIADVELKPSHLPAFHTYAQAEIKCKDCTVGQLGRCHPLIEKALGLNQPVYVAEINLNDILELEPKKQKVLPPPTFPATSRDWTVSVKEGLSFAKLKSACQKAAPSWLKEIELVSIYTDEKCPHGSQNLTLRFTYQSSAKTLTFEEAQKAHLELIETAKKELKEAIKS